MAVKLDSNRRGLYPKAKFLIELQPRKRKNKNFTMVEPNGFHNKWFINLMQCFSNRNPWRSTGDFGRIKLLLFHYTPRRRLFGEEVSL
jgi:hypothetical protein